MGDPAHLSPQIMRVSTFDILESLLTRRGWRSWCIFHLRGLNLIDLVSIILEYTHASAARETKQRRIVLLGCNDLNHHFIRAAPT